MNTAPSIRTPLPLPHPTPPPSSENSSGENCFATNFALFLLPLKSKIMKKKASGISILQKSSAVYQNCFQA